VTATWTVDDTIATLMGRLVNLEELVRWLSLAYGENEPVFSGADGYGTQNGLPLGSAPQMHTLWHQVTGTVHADGTWDDKTRTQCDHCGQWSVSGA
jgi:hypothetical protein